MSSSIALRRELSARAQQIATDGSARHNLTLSEVPSVIFAPTDSGKHGNFHPTSYRNILANPAWQKRLTKVHTSSPKAPSHRRWMELDSATSSDALLMNIFCYSRVLKNTALCALLGVAPGHTPQFGFKPGIPLREKKVDRTEIDMKLGNLLVEAKLTENDFQTAPVRLLERYLHLEEVLDCTMWTRNSDRVCGYQLIRGVLAANSTGGSFCVLCDARRSDLIENWYAVMRTVRRCDLRCRLQLLTWQELARVLPVSLQRFLAMKYGIIAPTVCKHEQSRIY
jgi:hypothetical protein